MKPIHNKVYCHGCGRPKMLFESQAKADNFLRFNSEGIKDENGKAPVRSYYCEICLGYHVTSNPSIEAGERLSKRDHQLIKDLTFLMKEPEEVKAMRMSMADRLNKIHSLLLFGQTQEAEDKLDICRIEYDDITSQYNQNNGKLTSLRSRIDSLYTFMSDVKQILAMPEEEQTNFLAKPNMSKVEKTLSTVLENIRICKKVDDVLSSNDEALDRGVFENIQERLADCRKLLGSIQRAGKKEVNAAYVSRMQGQEHRAAQLRKAQKAKHDKTHAASHLYGSLEYKSTILSLIERLESIQKSFNDGDYDACETAVEIGYFMLDELVVEDKNTNIIKQQLDQWDERLRNLGSVNERN